MDLFFLRNKLQSFLEEDIFFEDFSSSLDDFRRKCNGYILVKEDTILAGIDIVVELFKMVDNSFKVIQKNFRDGEFVKKGNETLKFEGRGDLILRTERVALNLLQRMCGIATNTKKYVDKVKGTGIKILDTRKTTPGFRVFEKYAVRVGGGYNHRMGLFDAVMIKDNHLKLIGKDFKVLKGIRENIPITSKLEIECETLEDVKRALEVGADIIMLDNFSKEKIKEAIDLIDKRAKIEISGGINLHNLMDYVFEGVDYISTSKVITEAKWIDISLEID